LSRTTRSGFTFYTSFGHQPKLWNALRIDPPLVTEGDWFERKERFAGPLHWLKVFFKPPEEAVVPILPFELMKTAVPPEGVAPKI
jgi:hypothetical protein